MTISVVVPWRSQGDKHRESAWKLVRDHWSGWEVYTADDGHEPFSRAASINLAVNDNPADCYVVADADILTDHAQVARAVDVAQGSPGMVIAYTRYTYLSLGGTQHILDGYQGDLAPFIQFSLDWTVSSCIAVSHETWETVGGFDPRFRGWGMEDIAFEIACRTLAGPTRRVSGDCTHLWHPTEPNRPAENVELLEQYRQADGDPDAMRALMARV